MSQSKTLQSFSLMGKIIDRQVDKRLREFTIDYRDVRNLDALGRARLTRQGLARRHLETVSACLAVDLAVLGHWLRIDVRLRRGRGLREALSQRDTERLGGLIALVGEALKPFPEDDSKAVRVGWLGKWLSEPLPAPEGQMPDELLSTPDGRAWVTVTLLRATHGIYA